MWRKEWGWYLGHWFLLPESFWVTQMSQQNILHSHSDTFHYFIMLVWPCISPDRESSWRWSLSTSSSQCHNNPVFFPPSKPPDPVKDIYEGQTYDLKTRVDIWTRIYVVPVEYRTFSQKFHLEMWLFQFITGINFKWDYIPWCIIALLVCIGLWTKLRIYKVPLDPVIWSCWGFGYLQWAFIIIYMLGSKNDLKAYQRKKFNAP